MLAADDRSRTAAPIYHPLVLLVCAVAAGIATDRWLPIAALAWWLIAAATVSVWLLVWLARRDAAASCLVLTAFFATGAAWHHDSRI